MVDFIGIGAARAGTTWISDVLRRHPEIGMSEPKEVRYFNRYVFPLGANRDRLNPDHQRSLDWYERHFRTGGRVKGEFTPLYLYDEVAPAAIHRSYPDVKLICIMRNPADRAYSHYWLYRNSGMLPQMSFEEALETEPVFLEMGFYAKQLERYLERFQREQMLLLSFDELVADPAAKIRRILKFLNVVDEPALNLATGERNQPVAVRSTRLKLAAHAVSRGMAKAHLGSVVRLLRRFGVHDLVRKAISKKTSYPPMPAETRQRLIETYAADVAALEKLLDRDLSAWK